MVGGDGAERYFFYRSELSQVVVSLTLKPLLLTTCGSQPVRRSRTLPLPSLR